VGFVGCVSKCVERQSKSSCDELVWVFANCIGWCVGLHGAGGFEEGVWNVVTGVAERCGGVESFVKRLCGQAADLPLGGALCEWLRGRLPSHSVTPSCREVVRNAGRVVRLPLRRPAGGGVRLSEVLRRLLGDGAAVGVDFELYRHQVEALEPLLGGGSVGVLLASPNASGKTEVDVLGALGAVARGGGRLVLVLYPTRALARDQFER